MSQAAASTSPTVLRRRSRTRALIASEAARLAAGQGVTGTTVEQIAEAAEIGRATFFRYFGTKEWAVAEGFAQEWLAAVAAAIARQPPELTATGAVQAAFTELADGFGEQAEVIRQRAELARSHPPLQAWTLQVHVEYETTIAELVRPRFTDLRDGDLRPRLVGAVTMAVVRLAVDNWLAEGEAADLPSMIAAGLSDVQIP